MASHAETKAEELLKLAGITVNGKNPWDMQVHNPKLFQRVIAEGSLGLGEAYMDGWWDCEALDQFFEHIVRADLAHKVSPSLDLIWLWLSSTVQNRQDKNRVFQVADVHYNLGADVFADTFDKRLTGSCGYWSGNPPATNLDDSQDAKLDLVCRKIGLKPGETVYDIGCGWGAFLGYAAEKYGAKGVGVTVSSEQIDYAKKRYAGLPIDFQLMDYRNFKGGPVDKVVSMGMFEHVGSKNYRTYFEGALRAMKPDGLFLLHTIIGNYKSNAIDPWLNKYIFPNGVLPTVGQIGTAVEGLFVVEDFHNFGPDYDKTLMAWANKFATNRAKYAAMPQYGERFCRMWEYYYLCCAAGFRTRDISVGQFVLSPKGVPEGYKTVR
jgi:cyclopropane-fatty-acyl-phospholipid synthase